MNRYFSLFVTLSIFYLINQPDLVLTSSGGGYGGGGGGASKLNLGVWIPPMTLRLPKFNMPKIKISATIKPRKNQPPMKIHLPEMSLNAKALGDDDNYGGGNSYGGSGGGGYSSGGSSYSSSGSSYGDAGGGGYSGSSSPSYSTGGSSYGGGNEGSSYGGGDSYSGGGGDSYSSGGSSPYRASASNQPNNYQPNTAPQQSNDYQANQQPNYNQMTSNDYSNRYQQQDQRNAYYVDNQQQQQPSRYQTESVSYGASNSVPSNAQSSYRQPLDRNSNYRSSGVMPLSNYAKRDKNASAYGYAVNSRYAARN